MQICGPRSMKAQKCKSSTPEPQPMSSKALKRDETICAPQISNGGPLCTLSVNRHISISTPAKGKGFGMTVPDGAVTKDTLSQVQAEDHCFMYGGMRKGRDGEDCGSQRLTTRKSSSKMKSTLDSRQEEGHSVAGKRSSEDSSSDSDEDEFEQLDLERKSQQHNLTSVNVRTILHVNYLESQSGGDNQRACSGHDESSYPGDAGPSPICECQLTASYTDSTTQKLVADITCKFIMVSLSA